MGSLMAGWDSRTLDPKSVRLQRNRSLTKEGIDAFWKSKKEKEEEHLRAISSLSETLQASKYQEPENKFNKSSTINLTHTKENSVGMDLDTSLEELIKKNGWWTKSSWAFLNEPPVIEAPTNKYAAQFHVANLSSSKFNGAGDGISAS